MADSVGQRSLPRCRQYPLPVPPPHHFGVGGEPLLAIITVEPKQAASIAMATIIDSAVVLWLADQILRCIGAAEPSSFAGTAAWLERAC